MEFASIGQSVAIRTIRPHHPQVPILISLRTKSDPTFGSHFSRQLCSALVPRSPGISLLCGDNIRGGPTGFPTVRESQHGAVRSLWMNRSNLAPCPTDDRTILNPHESHRSASLPRVSVLLHVAGEKNI